MPNSKNSPNFSGIRKRKWGEYVAEKWDPITRKLVWSGTFNTAEEASEAYLMKQREFASARHMLDEMVSNKIAAASDAERSKGYTFNTAEEASEVCLVKQCEFASARHMFDEMPSNEIVAASAAERSKGYTFNTAEEGSEVCLMKQCEFASAHHLYDEMPSSNLTSKTAAAPKTLFIKEISFRDKSPLLGAEWHNMGRLKKNDPFKKRRNPVKVMNQGKEPVTHVETDRCYTVKRGCKGKTGLVGIRSLKSGKYGAEIRDPIKNKPVWLGTFDTIEEASQAYLSKKCEFDVLSQGNCDQTQPLSSLCRNKKMDSSKTTRSIVGVRKNKWGKYTSEIIDPISKKKIWLGTFSTYEEASKAYRSKKLEFQGLVKLKKECSKKMHSTSREKKQVGKEKLVNAKQGYLYGERFQPKSAAEGILHANQYMKLDVQGSKEAELQSKMLVDFSTPEKQGYVNGERFQPKSATEEMLHANKYMKLDVQGSKEAELQSKMPVDFSTLEKQSYVNGERFQPKSAAEASLHANQYMKLDVQGSKEPELQSKMPVDFSTLEKQGYVNGERFQPKSAAEASLHANQYMKLDVQGSKEAELQSKMPVDFSTLEKQSYVNGEIFQPVSAAEESLHANQYMKLDVQGSKEVELQSKMPVDFSTLKKKKGGQEDIDLSMGQWVQLQDGREVKISLDLGLPIIDNYGSLLGEFSSLDDLRIYDENIY